MTLDKSIESWAQVTVGAVIGGSYAQIGSVLHMALHDIAELAVALREARAEVERHQSACEAAWRYIAERGLWLDYKKHERSEQED